MAKSDTAYWGDEDPEFSELDSPEEEQELFATAKFMGWTPEDMTQDPKFAERYRDWLSKQG